MAVAGAPPFEGSEKNEETTISLTRLLQQAVATLTVAVLLVLGLGDTPSQAVGRVLNTPPREITTVIANLDKAYGGSYIGRSIHDMSSIKAFVAGTIDLVKYYPDVLLLSEIRAEGAKAAAKFLTNKTNQKYIVAVYPGQHPVTEYPGKQIHKETTIILNATTMKQHDRGGFFKSTYTRDEAAPKKKIAVKKHAYVSARQISSGGLYAFTSVHFTPVSSLKSKAVSDRLRKVWSEQIRTKMHRKYPNAVMTNLGGDFNTIRCYSGAFKACQEAKFWKYLTGQGFVDSLYVLPLAKPGPDSCMTRATGVDYIFSTGQPLNGGIDYKGGYSDHEFRWAVNEAKAYKPC